MTARNTAAKTITSMVLIFLVLTAAVTRAAGLKDDLLRIHANIVPKTVLMDYNFREKLVNGHITVSVLCMKKDMYYARNLKKYIESKYISGLEDLEVRVNIETYRKFAGKPCSPSTIYYLLPASDSVMRSALKHLENSHTIIFSYDPAKLRNGAHISLLIGYRVKPVLNLAALKSSGITLRPAIIRISDIYVPDSSK